MNDQPRTKRPPGAFRLHCPASDSRRCQVVGERQILELISLGAPLLGILNTADHTGTPLPPSPSRRATPCLFRSMILVQ